MARDGHEFSAYLVAPTGPARGALVMLQEIFGVNEHIREQADDYASQGYLTIVPALYDRIGRRIETGYGPEDMDAARGYMLQIKPQDALTDIGASINVVKHAGRVALLGYCWGGTLAWIGARTLPVKAAVAYYPGRIGEHLDAVPACPTLLHFAARDAQVSAQDIERLRAASPSSSVHVYPAEHGFNCSERAAYDAASAALARQRTLEFLAQQLN